MIPKIAIKIPDEKTQREDKHLIATLMKLEKAANDIKVHERVCRVCGATLEDKRMQYCSLKCKKQFYKNKDVFTKKKPRIATCGNKNCGKEFAPTGANHRYCSEACKAENMRMMKKLPVAEEEKFKADLISFLSGFDFPVSCQVISRNLERSGQKVAKTMELLAMSGLVSIVRRKHKNRYMLKRVKK